MIPLGSMNIEDQELHPVTSRCPICSVEVPILYVRAERKWLNVRLEVYGDATDFVTHLWSHGYVRLEDNRWAG